MAVLHSDDFNRANSTGLGGAPWGTPSGSVNIVSNAVSIDGSTDTQVDNSTAIPGNDNAYCQAKLTVVGAGTESGPGFIMAKTDGVAYRLVVATASTNITLARLNPSYSVLWNRSATFSNGNTVRMEIIGTIFRVYINGIQVGADQTIPSWVGTLNCALGGSSSFTSATADDWEMGTIDVLGIPSPIADVHAGRFGNF